MEAMRREAENSEVIGMMSGLDLVYNDIQTIRFIDVPFECGESSLQKEVNELEKKQSDDLKKPEDEARSNEVLLEDDPDHSDDDEIDEAPLDWWDCDPSLFWLKREQLKKKFNERHEKRMARLLGIPYMVESGDEAAEAAFSRILRKKNMPEWFDRYGHLL